MKDYQNRRRLAKSAKQRRMPARREGVNPSMATARVRFHNHMDGRLLESDVIIATPAQWLAMPEATQPNWQSAIVGDAVIAHRVFG